MTSFSSACYCSLYTGGHDMSRGKAWSSTAGDSDLYNMSFTCGCLNRGSTWASGNQSTMSSSTISRWQSCRAGKWVSVTGANLISFCCFFALSMALSHCADVAGLGCSKMEVFFIQSTRLRFLLFQWYFWLLLHLTQSLVGSRPT